MFCTTCNLEYPDHLNFCRSCGQALVRTQGERATESVCCTRCGARVVRGEKFCQNCGAKADAATQETVIGVCQNCESYWRNGWQYCKSCGVDRVQALQLNLATGTVGNANASVAEDAPATGRTCPYCLVFVQPFSLFCENCGMRFAKTDELAGKSPVTAGTVSTADDALSRLDDLLLDDPLAAKEGSQSLKGVPALQANNVSPFNHASKELPASKSPEPKLAAAPLHLVETARKAESGERAKADLSDLSAAVPIAPSSWREAVTVATNNDNVRTETPAPRPVSTGFSSSQASFLLDEEPPRPRPFWPVPLLLGAFLLCAFLLIGVFRKGQETQRKESQSVANASVTPTANVVNPPAGMVFIPGGKFEMGRADASAEEGPVRSLEVKPFYLDRTEVTNQQYQTFVEATGHKAPPHWRNGKPIPSEANYPVVNVTWQDASDFALWAKKRLPTEEEWEFAARGTDGRLYPWGKNWEASLANTFDNNTGKIVEVGRYLAGASPYGVVDMCGNVWEWTSSQLRAYGTQELLEDGVMVIRGGAFDSPKEYATMSYRGAVRIDKPYPKTGFRCARDFP